MGVASIAAYRNGRKLHTRTGGRWGVGAVHRMLTRTSCIGRHGFNRRTKNGDNKPDDQISSPCPCRARSTGRRSAPCRHP